MISTKSKMENRSGRDTLNGFSSNSNGKKESDDITATNKILLINARRRFVVIPETQSISYFTFEKENREKQII